MLKLTEKELNSFINGNIHKRFKVVFDNIPLYHEDHESKPGDNHRQYIEDDGREFRWFIFKDTKTDIEYYVNYTYHADWPGDVSHIPDSIVIVDSAENSDIYELPEVVAIPEKVLTDEQKADKELMSKYELTQDKNPLMRIKFLQKLSKSL